MDEIKETNLIKASYEISEITFEDNNVELCMESYGNFKWLTFPIRYLYDENWRNEEIEAQAKRKLKKEKLETEKQKQKEEEQLKKDREQYEALKLKFENDPSTTQ